MKTAYYHDILSMIAGKDTQRKISDGEKLVLQNKIMATYMPHAFKPDKTHT